MKRSQLYILFSLLVPALAFCQAIVPVSEPVSRAEDSSKIRIQRLGINSSQSDFCPQILDKNLIFVSGRPNELAVAHPNELNSEVTDLFYAVKRDSVRFGVVKPFSRELNSVYNEGPFSISRDGKMIYFSGNAKEVRSKKSISRLQIYTSKKLAGGWESPQPASFCDGTHSNFHPSLSVDNCYLVFCSDMPGGYGGIDLYGTKFENGQWGKPVNLGPSINSAFNELFPYISDDNMLYFSSNRIGGHGGLDLYTINLGKRDNSAAILLEPPLNSTFDDFGFHLDSSGTTGYFSTNRIAKYSDDVYYFYSYPDFSLAKTPPEKTKFCYTFFEEKNGQEDETINSSYEWDFGNGEKRRGETCKYCFNKPGNYTIQLNIVEKNSGEVFYNKVTYTLTVEEPPRIFIDCADTLDVGGEVIINADKCRLKGYELNDFYWSFGDGRYNQGKYVKHRYQKEGTYKMELGVIARNSQTQKVEKFRIVKNIIVKSTL